MDFSDLPDDIRVIADGKMPATLDISPSTWLKLKNLGDTPPKATISEGRFGYRVSDIKKWLDARTPKPTARDMLNELAKQPPFADGEAA
jgi:predicted DNA-binding transcriptional regulator AlpA